MFGKLFDTNERELNKIRPLVTEINSLEEVGKRARPGKNDGQTNQWIAELKGKATTSKNGT